MVRIGYALSSEEHRPNDLVRNARRAEEAGFTFALISDHFHPWIEKQGQSPFVWSVIGGIAQATERLVLGTGVTCPTFRIHPAIIAQAAATAADMMPGRFFLGVGSGENLNEHVVGVRWPPSHVRQEMLEEAVEIIRELWKGESFSHYGDYYEVENARIYTLPDSPPPIVIAAGGPQSARLAAHIGDGVVSTSSEKKLMEAFRGAGGAGKSAYGKVMVCWAATEEEGRRTAHEQWPTAGLHGELNQELPLPAHLEQATTTVREEDVAAVITCGPDPAKHIAAIQKFIDAGFDHVYIHQVGADQEGFFRFYEKEVLPQLHAEGQAEVLATGRR